MAVGRAVLSLLLIFCSAPFFVWSWRWQARDEQERLTQDDPSNDDGTTLAELIALAVGLPGIGLIWLGVWVYISR